MPHPETTELRLSDGWVANFGPTTSVVKHIDTEQVHVLSAEIASALDTLIAGRGETLSHNARQELAEVSWLESSKPHPDPILRERLADIDANRFALYHSQLPEIARRAYTQTLAAHALRKRFDMGLGQCAITPESALRRALHIGLVEKVGRQQVLCIGDDDLVAVALASLGHEVTVYDVDSHLGEIVRAANVLFELDIQFEFCDLNTPTPWQGRPFDAVLTDPMSNTACIQLFLDCGLERLRPGGRAFVAIAPEGSHLIDDYVERMNMRLVRWMRRHNRYYTSELKLHAYESDWVELEKSQQPQEPAFGAELTKPSDLYKLGYYRRPPVLHYAAFEITNLRYALPLYLDMVVSEIIGQCNLNEIRRQWHASDDWSLIHAATTDGYLALHVNRPNKELRIVACPATSQLLQIVEDLICRSYKPRATQHRCAMGRRVWDICVR